MSAPRIRTEQIGFGWLSDDGRPTRLSELLLHADADPARLLSTHVAAVDELLGEVAVRFAALLTNGQAPDPGDHDALAATYRVIDRLTVEYATARSLIGGDPPDPVADALRAGRVLASGALVSIRARDLLSMTGPVPFDGMLDELPARGLTGRARLAWRDEPWQGARWLLTTDDGRRVPTDLRTLLAEITNRRDRESILREHREALDLVVLAAAADGAEPMAASGAVDWLLFDWLMAHRDEYAPQGVRIHVDRVEDARMLIGAATISARLRARYDPNLVGVL